MTKDIDLDLRLDLVKACDGVLYQRPLAVPKANDESACCMNWPSSFLHDPNDHQATPTPETNEEPAGRTSPAV